MSPPYINQHVFDVENFKNKGKNSIGTRLENTPKTANISFPNDYLEKIGIFGQVKIIVMFLSEDLSVV